MALKFKYESKDAVPAEHAGHYVERDGAWVLDVDGAVERAKVEEFRTTNVALMKERDELKRRFERSDSEAVRTVAAERDALNARLAAIQSFPIRHFRHSVSAGAIAFFPTQGTASTSLTRQMIPPDSRFMPGLFQNHRVFICLPIALLPDRQEAWGYSECWPVAKGLAVVTVMKRRAKSRVS